MFNHTTTQRSLPIAIVLAVGVLTFGSSDARVTRIEIDTTTNIAGQPYQELTGRAFGELDPNDSHNTLITDIALAPRNANGKVAYVASWRLRKPVDMTLASGVMWHDVPNRGGNVNFNPDLFAAFDMHLLSGWQGDNAGGTAVPANVECLPPYTIACPKPTFTNHYVKVPVLAGEAGRIFGRIINRSGLNAAPLNVMGNPIPYFPANIHNNRKDTLTIRTHETITGIATEAGTVPNSDWIYCGGGTFDAPLPVTGLPVQVCMKDGFDETKLYQLVYWARDPYVLGVGTAAFRDVQSFFRYEAADDFGTANPVAGATRWAIIRGSSQSGNFTRHLIFLGMNEDESGRIVHEGAWPLIAGRRVANNSRWGQPDGVLELYQMGSEGPQWWQSFPDDVRGLPPGGILDRCSATRTCPKIVETFGGAEVFALKMTTSWVGTDPKIDIPLPDNVRRYYLPSSTHGGGNGAMTQNPPATAVGCPGNNWGNGTLRANPVPATALVNRMRVALREWVINGTEPPPSVWPRLIGPQGERTLVDATQDAMGFPSGIPGIPDSIFLPENFIFPVLDYDWGPEFDHFNATGNPTNSPPTIDSVIKMLVPKVDSDGNELGGVPTVLRDAPLGTYLGWNITAGPGDATYNGRPFHKGQVCNYVGGMVPFAITKAERTANKDPRPSLQERYGSHDGYVAAVKAAADNAACKGYLFAGPAAALLGAACTTTLPPGVTDDWAALVNQAIASDVLK
ncbi:MAG TPA: alpha/beta hydrolase domain-containing protein [Casimicrobiaceae bacterium]|nr:alpha/beta hydrolase domain-containing protein [Casimicrobiaceae bacterium]